jgi:sortase family protein
VTGSTTGSRRGRYLLPAAIAGLTLVGGGAIVLGRQDREHEPPVAAAVTAPPSDAPSAATVPGELTAGPLMPNSPPARVSIPALKVDVPLIGLGQQADGAMEVPTDAKTVGWFTGAPTPGALGPAVLAGHVDYRKQPGSFRHLADLKPGDLVSVARRDGKTAEFAVTRVDRYAKNKFPTEAVYGPIDHAGLRLITCGGDFDDSTGHYRDNIVVYAALRRSVG